jgi:CDP-6-deoxy-D-xylo-4-hexulose-3-dehydrase
MVCTDNEDFYETVRMLRSHGMTREAKSATLKQGYTERHPDLHPNFIFAYPAWNVRSTEVNAVIGRSQLKRLDANNAKRIANLKVFLDNLDPEIYFTDFETEGSCNYAFTLILKDADEKFRDELMDALTAHGIEFRRGTSGGGNQLRQPYLKNIFGENEAVKYPKIDHVHFYGFYIGNYPDLQPQKVLALCELLNRLGRERKQS